MSGGVPRAQDLALLEHHLGVQRQPPPARVLPFNTYGCNGYAYEYTKHSCRSEWKELYLLIIE
jgi:hypothetical protein